MRLVSRFGPPLALMALIFFLSEQTDLRTGFGVTDLILRKLVHAATYALLWFLWLRALGWRAPAWAAAISLAYAVSDEVHQHFVPTRVGSPVDVAIDAVGIALAWWGWRRLDPAALGGDEHGLGAVDRAELAVDVVEVGADGARGE